MITIGLVGYGYWGPNLARNLAEMPDATLKHVADKRPNRLQLARRRHPAVQVNTSIDAMLEDSEVAAIAIATPTASHYDLAIRALRANKHVLLEKPIAATQEEAQLLVDEAERRELILIVGHTFVYTAAVRRIRQLIADGELGDILYYDSTRINLGLFQHEVDVIWDLGVHDLSILSYLIDEGPVAVSAVGKSHISGSPANIAFMTLFFASNTIAHININWLAPVKIRRTVIGGTKRMVVYDDLEPSEKIRVYDKGITMTDDPEQVHRMLVGYRIGDMWAPNLDTAEALSVEVAHFVNCIRTGQRPITDGRVGLRVVEMLEAGSRSMSLRGQPIELASP
jgi:predicted dehydrogenase